jgi:hypothetical protein
VALENGPARLEGEYNQDVFLCQLGETPIYCGQI